MKQDSSTECWNQVAMDTWVEKAQKNDFRLYYIMPYTLQKIGDVQGKKFLIWVVVKVDILELY
ncbi:hypothetical protein SH1V18_19190 [Vallitalea longa]|uniref:Uncharacterized protein n=1 Tax=Vallitalea longa TaxID=2936439 RepID=A0A9W5YCJ8_9FIRM|nr:hypothetical protein [Vallitalea longa]GKX29439.1 hypothetical protein SH1V18_19190 [Vallitalea longa]